MKGSRKCKQKRFEGDGKSDKFGLEATVRVRRRTMSKGKVRSNFQLNVMLVDVYT